MKNLKLSNLDILKNNLITKQITVEHKNYIFVGSFYNILLENKL